MLRNGTDCPQLPRPMPLLEHIAYVDFSLTCLAKAQRVIQLGTATYTLPKLGLPLFWHKFSVGFTSRL